jgi:ferric-dicitrate binding protein FerR (iron transport regulator)
MKNENLNNNFLARWISGELSSTELEEFKKTKDYSIYKRINESSQLLEGPDYDMDSTLMKIREEIKLKNQPKVRKLIPNIFYKVAASAIILLGVVYFFSNSTATYSTAYGEQLKITLPDNSIVHLNSNSELEFDKNTWKSNRELSLKGEAFFEVEKGSNCSVETINGSVEVLGTKFIVISQEAYLEVQCYEGKVRVNSNDKQTILNPTNAFRAINTASETWNFTNQNPTWLHGESSFTNTPLKQVISALENQFETKFNLSNIDTNKRFTGSFTHSDIKLALKTVFVPMNISFTFKGENSVVLDRSK